MSIEARILGERQILGLSLRDGNVKRTYYFEIINLEAPNILYAFALGTANALNTAGTGWSEVQDSQSRYYLEPEDEAVVYQFFFGISPGQAWVYRRYPSQTDINSLIGTRAVGDTVGFIDGLTSPFQKPSPVTEMFTFKGARPAFNGYHPAGTPASITVLLNFAVIRYGVKFLGVSQEQPIDAQRLVLAPESVRAAASVRTVGSRVLVQVPTWMQVLGRRPAA